MSETYTTGGDTLILVENQALSGQSFIPKETHILNFIDLELRGYFTINTPNILIYLAAGDNKPTGNYISRDRVITEQNSTFLSKGRVRFSMQAVLLEAGTKYCMVLSNYPPIGGNRCRWEYDAGDATYPRGCRLSSTDGGATWTVHYNDDHIFAEFGEPPLPKPTPPPPLPNFSILDISFFYCRGAVKITLPTNIPCHLTCYYTDKTPLKHHTERVIRGLTVPWGVYFCFVAWHALEQTEPGDTLYHTFEFPDWPVCTLFVWKYDLAPGSSPPLWEPWGATLTENHLWQIYPALTPPSVTISNSVIRIRNVKPPHGGIRLYPLVPKLPLQDSNGSPLHFNAVCPSAFTQNSGDWIAYIFHIKAPDQLNILELAIAHGSDFGPFGTFDSWDTISAGRDYGLAPGSVNLLEYWQWYRGKLGLSTDPTGVVLDEVRLALEFRAPTSTLEVYNEYLNFFYPLKVPDPTSGNFRHFTFRGEVDNIESPSVGPIFHHCYPVEAGFSNLTFATWPDKSQPPFPWTFDFSGPGPSKFLREETDVKTPPYALNLIATNSITRSQFFNSFCAQPYGGKTLKFEFWFKTVGYGQLTISIKQTGPGSWDWTRHYGPIGWIKRWFTAYIDPNAHEIIIKFENRSITGLVSIGRFDGITITEI